MTVTYSAPVLLEATPDAAKPFLVARQFSVTWIRPNGDSLAFVVRKGFTTDLASIPRAFRAIIPQVGRHIQPAVVHDWCYGSRSKLLTRADADLLFLEGMAAVGVSWWRRKVMYRAVRLFGSAAWS